MKGWCGCCSQNGHAGFYFHLLHIPPPQLSFQRVHRSHNAFLEQDVDLRKFDSKSLSSFISIPSDLPRSSLTTLNLTLHFHQEALLYLFGNSLWRAS